MSAALVWCGWAVLQLDIAISPAMNLLDPDNFDLSFRDIAFPDDTSVNPVEAALRKVIARSQNQITL